MSFRTIFGKFENQQKTFGKLFWTNFGIKILQKIVGKLSVNVLNIFITAIIFITESNEINYFITESNETQENAFDKTHEQLFFEKFSVSFRTIFGKFENQQKTFGKLFWTNFGIKILQKIVGKLSVNVLNIFITAIIFITESNEINYFITESNETQENAFDKTHEQLFFEKFSVSFRTIFGKFENQQKTFGKLFWTNFGIKILQKIVGKLSVNVLNIFITAM